MSVNNFKGQIAALVKDLQKRLKSKDIKSTNKKWTQDEIGQHLYPQSIDPKELYRARFIHRVHTTQFEEDEIINFIRLFAKVMHPKEAVLLIAWSGVHKSTFDAVKPFFDKDAFETERHTYEQGIKRLNTLNDDTQAKTPNQAVDAVSPHGYIPLERTSPEYELVDLGSLVGIDKIVDNITDQLTAKSGSNFISVEGQGGLGKTSIAYAIVDRIRTMQRFKAVLWLAIGNHLSLADGVTALGYQPVWQQIGQQLQITEKEQVLHILQNESYLIVIDNIETDEDAKLALEGLGSLAQGNSRFLLTSRRELRLKYPFVYSYPLPYLSQQDSITLIKSLFTQRGMVVSEKIAAEVARVGGGIPLAMHLIERLSRVQPLNMILKEVSTYQAQTNDRFKKVEIMFEYIYGRIWQSLRDDVRDMLVRLALQIPAEGIYRDDAAISCGITEDQLSAALEQALEYYLIRQTLQFDGEVLVMHPLTIAYVRSRLRKAQ